MNLDQISYFVVAAQTQHIGLASKQLGISPSAISHSIRNLEKILGHSLFEKVGKNIYLSDFGKRFSIRAQTLLDEVEKLRIDFRSPHLPLEGTLRIGASHGVANLFLCSAFAQLQKQHPQLIFEVLSLRSAQVVELISKNELDLGLCFSPNPHPNITVLKKINMPLKIAVSPKHPLLKSNSKDLFNNLSRMTTTAPKAYAGIEVCEDHPALKKLGIKNSIGLISDSYEIAAEYIKQNSGWILIPEIFIHPLGLSALPIKNLNATANLSLIAPKGKSFDSSLINSLWPEI